MVVRRFGGWELYMQTDWIIDVLADLRSYAEMNGLPATAVSLEDATLVALAEVASVPARDRSGAGSAARMGHDGAARQAGNITWLFAGGDNG